VIPVALEDIAALDLGRLEGGEPGAIVTAIGADSREIGAGELFVALNTGVRYVDEARARGAVTLVPDDQDTALAALSSLVRARSSARVVAVVGSTGKTSTKDILRALCAPHAPTVASERSLNNEIGLPLTLFRLEPDTAIVVAEMGMRGLGQIAALCAVARPTVALVTSIGPEHLELLGSVERVAAANAEAIASLPAAGTAIAPAGARELDPYLERDDIEIRRFGPDEVELDDGHGRFHLDGRVVELELPFTQRHQALNTLAALHAYAALGLPLDDAGRGVPGIALSPWRGDEVELPGGGLVINDAYNANPDSMRAALEHLAERAGTRRKVAILGEMAELGAGSAGFHAEVADLARTLGIMVVGVGEGARRYEPSAWAPDAAHAAEVARSVLEPGDAILVKASRAVGLEGIADEITKIARAWSPS
jgi:UDP-N-acetylmuramoyl-tripeptide--D-alanyl-D-alanine ligase